MSTDKYNCKEDHEDEFDLLLKFEEQHDSK